ncbi:MAG: TonB family protein [Pseudomonadota bacterium]
MTFPRLLAAGLLVSVLLHSAGSAYFADDPNAIEIEASAGGGVSVIGSIEDMVAGSQVDAVEVTEPVEEVEPDMDPVEHVQETQKVAAVAPVAPVAALPPEAITDTPVSKAVPVEMPSSVPVVAGVTSVQPVNTSERTLEIEPEDTETVPTPMQAAKTVEQDVRPSTAVAQAPVSDRVEAAQPVEVEPVVKERIETLKSVPVTTPVNAAQSPRQKVIEDPVEGYEVEAQNPVEIEKAVAAEPVPVQEAVEPEADILEAVPETLTEATVTPKAKPEPPVRKTQPKKDTKKKKPVQQAQRKGSETNSRKGGEKVTSQSARATANGRADARSKDGGDKAKSNYRGRVQAKLRRAKRAPKGAKRKRLTGMVAFSFVISPSGSVSSIRLRRSSGNDLLDQAALDMIRRASPMPKFPRNMPLKSLPFSGAVRFE